MRTAPPPPADHPDRVRGAVPLLAGALGMVLVGGSTAISGLLRDAPLMTAQGLRYAVACVLLVGWARLRGHRVVIPRGREWLWLLGVAATGLVLFNVALVRGSDHAEPAVLAVAVASVPVVLAALGPLLQRSRPSTRVLLAATVVTTGAALVQGFGRSDGIGLAWAILILVCEAAFTLLAVPVLRRLGALGVSVWTTGLAAAMFVMLALGWEGPEAIAGLTGQHLLATAYLAVAVTAVAFVLWYGCVGRVGAARAGLLTGVAPVSAAVAGVTLGGALPTAAVWVGIAIVGVGLGIGLRSRRP